MRLTTDELWPVLQEELHRIASSQMSRESSDQTLQATALVNEAYLRLISEGKRKEWDNRAHFFAAAATAMRRILVDRARGKKTIKRGGDRSRVPFDVSANLASTSDADLLALDEALTRLEDVDGEAASVVKLRYFTGLTNVEAADILGVSERTVRRHWDYARAWLLKEMTSGGDR